MLSFVAKDLGSVIVNLSLSRLSSIISWYKRRENLLQYRYIIPMLA